MNILDAIILGIVQGITEFIPVSSSGHLLIAQNLLGLDADRLFIQFINIGTLLALLIYFRKIIIQIVKDIFLHKKYNLARNVIITAVPAGLAGVLLGGLIDSSWFFTSVVVTFAMFFIVGVVMIVLDKLPHASAVKSGASLSPKRALVIGLVQVLALVPGVSRSGSTIIAGRLAGLSVKSSAIYSFLVSIPLMFGVVLKTLVSDFDYVVMNWQIVLVSNLAAFVVGLMAVSFMINYLKTHSLAVFGWYRVAVATIFLAILLIH